MSSAFRPILIAFYWAWFIAVVMSWQEAWCQSFWATVLRVTGISATPSQLKGPDDEIQAGDIWVADLARKTRLQVTRYGGYRSPVFLADDDQILALKGNTMMQVSLSGAELKSLYNLENITKIVGMDKADPDKVLILLQNAVGSDTAGVLSLKSGQVTLMPDDRESPDYISMISHMREWERVYGDTKVYVRSESKSVMGGTVGWTDVYLKQRNSSPLNVSRCDVVNCGQPSLSNDGRQVVFVKAVE
jgi:hypothetical protein